MLMEWARMSTKLRSTNGVQTLFAALRGLGKNARHY
jgi:hypothetical protein